MTRLLRDPFAHGPYASMPPELLTAHATPAASRRRHADKTAAGPPAEEVTDE